MPGESLPLYATTRARLTGGGSEDVAPVSARATVAQHVSHRTRTPPDTGTARSLMLFLPRTLPRAGAAMRLMVPSAPAQPWLEAGSGLMASPRCGRGAARARRL